MQRPWILALALALPAPGGGDDRGIPLLRGDAAEQFDLVGIGPDSIRIAEGEVRLAGRPFGFFATKATYRDFVLAFEWKFDRPDDLADDARFRGNGGVLVQVEPPLAVWPNGVEIQLAQADPGSIFGLGEVEVESRTDLAAQKRAARPVGQWNRIEITSRAGTIRTVLNGEEVARATRAEPARGPIAWMSEGKPIRFRFIRIEALD